MSQRYLPCVLWWKFRRVSIRMVLTYPQPLCLFGNYWCVCGGFLKFVYGCVELSGYAAILITCPWLVHSHWFGSRMLCLWYYPWPPLRLLHRERVRRISAGSPHSKGSLNRVGNSLIVLQGLGQARHWFKPHLPADVIAIVCDMIKCRLELRGFNQFK